MTSKRLLASIVLASLGFLAMRCASAPAPAPPQPEPVTPADFVASIADVAVYPWVDVRWLHRIDIDQFPNVKRWYEQVGARPAVKRGMAVMAESQKIGSPDRKTREAFFGRTQLRQGRGGRTHLMSPAMAAAAAVSGRLVDVRALGR